MRAQKGFGALELLIVLVIALALAYSYMKQRRVSEADSLQIKKTVGVSIKDGQSAQQTLDDVQKQLDAAKALHEKALKSGTP